MEHGKVKEGNNLNIPKALYFFFQVHRIFDDESEDSRDVSDATSGQYLSQVLIELYIRVLLCIS